MSELSEQAWFKRRFQFRVARVDARRVCLRLSRSERRRCLTPSPCYPRNS